MRNQKIFHYFKIIDYSIKLFNANKGFKIAKSEHNKWTERDDWMPVDQRRILWTENGLNFNLTITPKIDEESKIKSWNLTSSVWYEKDSNVYRATFTPVFEARLDYIANNALKLLSDAYEDIIQIKKNNIPYSSSILIQ